MTKKNENASEMLMEKLLKSRRILLSEEVNMETSQKIIDKLFLLEQDDSEKPIYLFINSPGGEVCSGLAIYDAMEFIKPKVITVACGLVASIASIIYLQPEKESRLSLPHAEFLLHQPLGGVKGSASELEIHANHILKTRSRLNLLIADKTGQDLKKVEENTRRDFWMDAEEAVNYGLAKCIIKNASELD
jgi:ATP-dependent Clp protease protease subunit